MFEKFRKSKDPDPSEVVTGPYAQTSLNLIYHLLFCDRPELFRPRDAAEQVHWQEVLFAAHPNASAVREVAQDQTLPSRCRALAYRWLRQNGEAVPARELLGTIVEVPLAGGVDVLAAYTDDTVRYINQTGSMSVFEPATNGIAAQARNLLAASRAAVAHLGPWTAPRLAPPAQGRARVSFVVSDGLYFGEGQLPGIDRDPIGAPIFAEAGKLLTMVVDAHAAAKDSSDRPRANRHRP